MRVLFLGTPQFAVPVLEAVIASANHIVAGVVTQPDRYLKRGKTKPSAVKECALRHGLKVIQPEKIGDCVRELKMFDADIAVTAAYGQILTQGVLDAFPLGVINVHASLLPKYRGASPIYSAILNGEKITGVTIMQTELGLDTGCVLGKTEVEIEESDTAGTLENKLSLKGAELLINVLDIFADIEPHPQDDNMATLCKTIKKGEEYIDFSRDAENVVNQIRALSPSPCAKTVIAGETYKIYFARVSDCKATGAPGEIVECGKRLVIACGRGCVEVLTIQAPSKRALAIDEFLRGRKLPVGEICGTQQ